MKPALNKDKELIEELNLLIQNKLDWGDASQIYGIYQWNASIQ